MANSKKNSKINSNDEIVIGVEEKTGIKDFLKKAEAKLKVLSQKASEKIESFKSKSIRGCKRY